MRGVDGEVRVLLCNCSCTHEIGVLFTCSITSSYTVQCRGVPTHPTGCGLQGLYVSISGV